MSSKKRASGVIKVVDESEVVPVADNKAKPRNRVGNVEFVTAYKASKSYGELAEKTGLTKASVQVRCASMRKRGVNLPKFARAVQAFDADALNAILVAP